MDIAARIASLSPAKRALLELALEEQLNVCKVSVAPVILRQPQRNKAPLSFAQQRLWFLDQLHPGKADYNLPQVLHLNGPLNVTALCDALNTIIARHEALRTTFTKHGAEGQQLIASELIIELPLIDLHDHKDKTNKLQQLIDTEIARPFDLTSGPLLRAQLFRLAPQQHTLLVTMHHIVSDGWSMEIFNRELGTIYNAYCHHQAAALAELPVQYLDYAVWQRLQTTTLQQQLNYWRQQLHGAPQVLELPADKVRPTVQSFHGEHHSIDLTPQLSAALKQLTQKENATLFMVLLGAYQVLLHRYSGQDDILVGTPIAGRTHTELEGLIGFFVNSLVMRARFTPKLSFRQLLAQVRETALGAFSHQELPFEKLVEELAPQRDMSRNPLFQVMFSLQNDVPPPQMEQLSVSTPEIGINKAKFDLTLFVNEQGSSLRVTFNYAADLFHDTTIKRMADHYLTLLTAIVKNPDQNIATLPLLTATELAQLTEWNNTGTTFGAELCVQSIFEHQAAQTPEAAALIFKDQNLSYRELNLRANQLAHYLIQQGVRPESRVGICMDRSIDAVITVLAIIKAGGAYVPLDVSYPEARLRFMLEDSQVALILTHKSLIRQSDNRRIIDLDQAAAEICACDDSNPVNGDDPERLLYVMYTSGSTGTPKGVEVPHRAVNRLVQNSGFADLGTSQVFMLLAPLSFDASTFEIWGALLNGGRCVIYPERLPEFDTLARVIRDNSVTTLWLTASLFNKLIDEAPQTLADVKQLLTGGEALSVDHIRRAQQALPGTQFINGYGPTENTTFTCCYHIPRPLDETLMSIPIGHPIGNTRVYVLDPQMQQVPVGVPGELYAAGAGLARGYQNRADLTAERFVDNPFAAGEKLYKTGDLVRYLTDGNLEFLGRIDHQIKLRGFRIELGEIEAVLRRHSQVDNCTVVLREDTPGDKRLVAYAIPQPQHEISEQTLRQYMKEQLPEYMVPAAIVIMDELPLTANGKIDHKALPPPSATPTGGAGDKPRNTFEFHLIKIWEDVLGRNPIGIHDNFFELGGHSLLAVKLFDQIEKHFGKKLPLDTLWFEGATVETLASILEREQETILWPELVQIKAGGDMTPLFCIHTMGGNLFHYYELARALSPQLPVYGLQARGVYGKQTPRDNIADIANDCINAMRQRQASGPYRIAGFSSGGIVAFEMAQQLHAAGEVVSCLALLDCYAPGVSFKRNFWKELYKFLTFKNLRRHQERIYHQILHPLGLRRLRNMKTIGEIHRWAHWSYKPEPYPRRIDLFVASESEKHATDPLLGWSKVARGELMIHSVPGTHGLMVKHPDVEVLAEQLQYILDYNNQ
jgi:amino acid adenylation domain-containing protein